MKQNKLEDFVKFLFAIIGGALVGIGESWVLIPLKLTTGGFNGIGMLAYNKYDHVWKKQITTEISTGRPIAELIKRSDGTYWKVYGTIDTPKYDGECYVGCQHRAGEPIQITREEFCKLNTVCGSHLVL